MEFVIWGAGNRGKIAAEIIGYHRIKAFIDSDRLLQGTQCNEVPIIDIEQYLGRYGDCFLVVSPYQNQEIIETLHRNGICNYLLLSDCPSELYTGQLETIDEISFPKLDFGKIIIQGLTLYSLLLWERLIENDLDVPILIQEKDSESEILLRSISSKIYYEKDYHFTSDQIIIQTMRNLPEKGMEIIDLYHLAGYTKKFYHSEMLQFQNIHKGQKCFVIGNGSSLRISDLDTLSNQQIICFGMNGIPIIFGDTKWRPDYYVCEDGKAMDIFENMILESQLNCIFVSDANKEFLTKADKLYNVNVFHMTIEDYMPGMPSFSENLENVLYCGYTVAYACIQIAAYMGFREIYLLGMDFDYADGDTMEVKHFSSGYHTDREKINPCRKSENLLAYQAAWNYAKLHGIRIFNATRGGKLEVFERVNFDNLF